MRSKLMGSKRLTYVDVIGIALVFFLIAGIDTIMTKILDAIKSIMFYIQWL